jgi:hypothetical protein
VTAETGTGVLNCDSGGEASMSASLLNICCIHQEMVSHPEQIQILWKSVHLYKYWCRLPTTNGLFPIDDCEGHSGYTFARTSATLSQYHALVMACHILDGISHICLQHIWSPLILGY